MFDVCSTQNTLLRLDTEPGTPPHTHTHTTVVLAVCSSSWAVSDKKGKVKVRAGKPEH